MRSLAPRLAAAVLAALLLLPWAAALDAAESWAAVGLQVREGRRPAPGIELRLLPEGVAAADPAMEASGVTDEQGRAVVYVQPGVWRLELLHGGEVAYFVSLRVAPGRRAEELGSPARDIDAPDLRWRYFAVDEPPPVALRAPRLPAPVRPAEPPPREEPSRSAPPDAAPPAAAPPGKEPAEQPAAPAQPQPADPSPSDSSPFDTIPSEPGPYDPPPARPEPSEPTPSEPTMPEPSDPEPTETAPSAPEPPAAPAAPPVEGASPAERTPPPAPPATPEETPVERQPPPPVEPPAEAPVVREPIPAPSDSPPDRPPATAPVERQPPPAEVPVPPATVERRPAEPPPSQPPPSEPPLSEPPTSEPPPSELPPSETPTAERQPPPLPPAETPTAERLPPPLPPAAAPPEQPPTPEPEEAAPTPLPTPAPPPAAEPVLPPAPPRFAASAAGECPDCREDEAAAVVERTVMPRGGPCGAEIAPAALDAARRLAGRATGPQPLEGGGLGASTGGAGCQVLGVVLPAGATYRGYRYEVEGGGDAAGRCYAGDECPVPGAAWPERPTIRPLDDGSTLVYGLFRNASPDRARRARLTVYYQP